MRDQRQVVIGNWARDTFGESAMQIDERARRFLEEALELAQACGVSLDDSLRSVRVVYARPAGSIEQEMGGVGTTLLTLAQMAGFSADECEASEVRRVMAIPREKFIARHAEKKALGISR